jgi:CDP-diacylglycerol--serine O-phosphatidyltransferase
MKREPYFIVYPSWVDFLTLGSLLLSVLGLLAAFYHLLSLAIVFMLLSMFVDMLDGFLARRFKMESQLGLYLDSFCDAFAYLVLPLFILYQIGMNDVFSLVALFAFLACGILRLARFNILSTVEDEGVKYHLGLQVIWSHLVVVLVFPLWLWLGEIIRYPLVVLLLGMSFFMIRNLRFRKPTQYKRLTVLIFSVAGLYLYLHLTGIYTP